MYGEILNSLKEYTNMAMEKSKLTHLMEFYKKGVIHPDVQLHTSLTERLTKLESEMLDLEQCFESLENDEHEERWTNLRHGGRAYLYAASAVSKLDRFCELYGKKQQSMTMTEEESKELEMLKGRISTLIAEGW